MEINAPAAIATGLLLGAALWARYTYCRARAWLAGAKQASWAAGYTEGYKVGHLEGERAGRAAGLQDGIAIGYARGAGETEIRLRKTDLSEYQRGWEEAMATRADFERAERGRVAQAA